MKSKALVALAFCAGILTAGSAGAAVMTPDRVAGTAASDRLALPTEQVWHRPGHRPGRYYRRHFGGRGFYGPRCVWRTRTFYNRRGQLVRRQVRVCR